MEKTPLIGLQVHESAADEPLEWFNENFVIEEMRSNEKQIVQISREPVDDFEPVYIAVYSLRRQSKLEASLSIATTTLVCVFFAVGAAFFSKTT